MYSKKKGGTKEGREKKGRKREKEKILPSETHVIYSLAVG